MGGLGRSARGARWHVTGRPSLPRPALCRRLLYLEKMGPPALGSDPRGRLDGGRGPRRVAVCTASL